MDRKPSALYSEYIIDGVAQELTPAQMLDVCLSEAPATPGKAGASAMAGTFGALDPATQGMRECEKVGSAPGAPAAAEVFAPVIDETLDPALKPCVTDEALLEKYLRKVRALKVRDFPMSFPETYTKFRVATGLLDVIWRKGHFRLGDLSLRLDWTWSPQRIGDMASFYASVQSAADYIDALGLKIRSYDCKEAPASNKVEGTEAQAANKVEACEAPASNKVEGTEAQAASVEAIEGRAGVEAFEGRKIPATAQSFAGAEGWAPARSFSVSAELRGAEPCRQDPAEEDSVIFKSEALLPSDEAVPGGRREEKDFFEELPWGTEHPVMRAQNAHPSRLLPDAQSWLIYVPFENADYRLGASALAQVLGVSGAVAPQLEDADYFIDCYEIVRELVEDGVVLSGVTVSDGGLLPALRRMCSSKVGCTVDLSALKSATGESDPVRLLFSEVPGVLFQIADIDYDYVDAELLLQDVAYYPLGHPTPGEPGVRVSKAGRTGIQTILESLIRSQSPEGED